MNLNNFRHPSMPSMSIFLFPFFFLLFFHYGLIFFEKKDHEGNWAEEFNQTQNFQEFQEYEKAFQQDHSLIFLF